MLTIEPRMVIIFWACSPISYKHIFLVSVLGVTPHHIPYKSRCSNKKSNWMRVVYLSDHLLMLGGAQFSSLPLHIVGCIIGLDIVHEVASDYFACSSSQVSPGDVPLDQLDPKQRHDLLKWVYKTLNAWSLHLLAWKSSISLLRNVSIRLFSDGKLPKVPYGMRGPSWQLWGAGEL